MVGFMNPKRHYDSFGGDLAAYQPMNRNGALFTILLNYAALSNRIRDNAKKD